MVIIFNKLDKELDNKMSSLETSQLKNRLYVDICIKLFEISLNLENPNEAEKVRKALDRYSIDELPTLIRIMNRYTLET